jgi:hypothetical protein
MKMLALFLLITAASARDWKKYPAVIQTGPNEVIFAIGDAANTHGSPMFHKGPETLPRKFTRDPRRR